MRLVKRGPGFRLDARTLAQARASSLMAIDPRAFSGSLALGGDRLQPLLTSGGTAVLSIRGPIAQRADHLWGWCEAYDALAFDFAALAAHPEVRRIVLDIDSPGGDLAGLEQGIARMVAARDASGKPVLAYVNELAASAAYWIAACVASSGVYLPIAGEVGSVGVIAALVDETAALEREGIKVTLIRDPAGKAEGHSMQPITDLAIKRLTGLVKESSARFVGAIAAARRISAASIRALNGGCMSGNAAVAAGLADGVASLEEVISMAARGAAKKRSTMNTRLPGAHSLRLRAAAPDNKIECPECGAKFVPEGEPEKDDEITCPECDASFAPKGAAPAAGVDVARIAARYGLSPASVSAAAAELQRGAIPGTHYRRADDVGLEADARRFGVSPGSLAASRREMATAMTRQGRTGASS